MKSTAIPVIMGELTLKTKLPEIKDFFLILMRSLNKFRGSNHDKIILRKTHEHGHKFQESKGILQELEILSSLFILSVYFKVFSWYI
jgi:hypothetical protein